MVTDGRLPSRVTLLLTCTKSTEVDRLGSGVRVSASFHILLKNLALKCVLALRALLAFFSMTRAIKTVTSHLKVTPLYDTEYQKLYEIETCCDAPVRWSQCRRQWQRRERSMIQEAGSPRPRRGQMSSGCSHVLWARCCCCSDLEQRSSPEHNQMTGVTNFGW